MCRRDMAWNAEAGMYELMSFLSYIFSLKKKKFLHIFMLSLAREKSYIF